MVDRDFFHPHNDWFWPVMVYETLWIIILTSAVIGSLIMGLSALAH
jgi:hypothetical protein